MTHAHTPRRRPTQAQGDGSSSRAATNELLGELRVGRWRASAWARFLAAATARSVEQARRHPRALGQATALHAIFLVASRGRRRRWVVSSWALTALHLGMLEDRPNLGVANTVTLVRANLPAMAVEPTPWLTPLALATDFVDGRAARRTGTTPFGLYADALADAAFWTWITWTRDDGRTLQVAALLAWLAPIAAVTATSLARGEMVEPPRPQRVRPAAALQVLITVRYLLDTIKSPTRRPSQTGVVRNRRLV